MSEVRVIGVPRSGTNLAKYLIEAHSETRAYFNVGWWKHGIISPYLSPDRDRHPELPTLVMFREPLEQVASFFNFARKGRTAISGASAWSEFLRSPIVMRSHNASLSYRYASPVEYWMQFYHAALSWSAPVAFVNLDQLQTDPRLVFSALGGLGLGSAYREPVALPNGYLSRNDDRHVSIGLAFESDTTVDVERSSVRAIIEAMSPEDQALIGTSDVRNTFNELVRRSALWRDIP